MGNKPDEHEELEGVDEAKAQAMRQFLAKERADREKACATAIDKVLSKYRCRLGVNARIDEGGHIVAVPVVLAQDK